MRVGEDRNGLRRNLLVSGTTTLGSSMPGTPFALITRGGADIKGPLRALSAYIAGSATVEGSLEVYRSVIGELAGPEAGSWELAGRVCMSYRSSRAAGRALRSSAAHSPRRPCPRCSLPAARKYYWWRHNHRVSRLSMVGSSGCLCADVCLPWGLPAAADSDAAACPPHIVSCSTSPSPRRPPSEGARLREGQAGSHRPSPAPHVGCTLPPPNHQCPPAHGPVQRRVRRH